MADATIPIDVVTWEPSLDNGNAPIVHVFVRDGEVHEPTPPLGHARVPG